VRQLWCRGGGGRSVALEESELDQDDNDETIDLVSESTKTLNLL
jgi:hypothetical protein